MQTLWSSSPQTPLQTRTTSPLPILTRRNLHQWRVSSTERGPNFEVDQEKARQALNDLDLQLETLSKTKPNSPKIKASSLGDMKVRMRETPPEITGSVLGYLAFILFIFSIFYNVLFITVIKPMVDVPDDTPEASAQQQP